MSSSNSPVLFNSSGIKKKKSDTTLTTIYIYMSIEIDNNIFFFQKQKIYNFLYIKMYLVCSLTTDMIYTIAIYIS